jgi:hypothetical protein
MYLKHYAKMMNLKKQESKEIQRNRSVFDFAFFSLTYWITKKLKINLNLYEVQQMKSADVNLHMAYVSKWRHKKHYSKMKLVKWAIKTEFEQYDYLTEVFI